MASERTTYPINRALIRKQSADYALLQSLLTKIPRVYPNLVGDTGPIIKQGENYTFDVIDLEEATDFAPSGSPIAFPMKFIGSTYKVYDKKGLLVDRQMSDFRLPAVHLASFSRRKLTEITNLGSGRGSVKEFDGHEDWTISITGLITPEDNHPSGKTSFIDILQELESYNDCMNAIEVSSELLTALGIYRVAIHDVSYSQIQGTKDNLEFSMTLLSDQEFELEILA